MSENTERAASDVLAERERQQSKEGWTPDHDDQHASGELAIAAACYAMSADQRDEACELWPWEPEHWKPKDERRNLVRAGALILAEIERLDRAKKAPKMDNPPAPDHVHKFTYEQGPDHRICEVCGADEPIQAALDAMTSELFAQTQLEDDDPPARWLRNRQDKWDARMARKFSVAFRDGWVPLLSSDTDELVCLLDRCADNMPLVGVGRGIVEITTTVRGPDEWVIIPQLWRLCAETCDKQAAEIVAAKQKVETALACVNSVIENNSFIVGSAIHHNLTVARERLSVAFNGSIQ